MIAIVESPKVWSLHEFIKLFKATYVCYSIISYIFKVHVCIPTSDLKGKWSNDASSSDSMSLLQKVKSEMGSPDWNVSMDDIHLWKLLWVYCPGHAGLKGNDQADRQAGKTTLTNGLLLGRSKMLRSLIHYLWVQSQGHYTINCQEERGMERGSARQSSLKGRERAIFNQTNTGTVSKVTLGKLLGGRMEFLRAQRYHLELNWPELKFIQTWPAGAWGRLMPSFRMYATTGARHWSITYLHCLILCSLGTMEYRLTKC